jgi:hypothetical protein
MSTIGSDTPSTSRDVAIVDERLKAQGHRKQIAQRKALEEDEYLGRMASIIKRDFFSDSDQSNTVPSTPNFAPESQRTEDTYDTPMTDRTGTSAASSIRSRHNACSMRLNQYLDKYTSEDNAYFDKLQARQVRRHRNKYPWLYKDRDNHNKKVKDQLALTSSSRKPLTGDEKSATKMIDWHFNPTNTLFYPPSDYIESEKPQSTVNYKLTKIMREPIFKEPMPMCSSVERPKGLNRFTDKIGIDGKPLNGSDTPSLDEFNFATPIPETPRVDDAAIKTKHEANRFYIPCESPRDALAHRLYEDKISRKIRTPKSSTRSDSKTPKTNLNKIFS